MGKNKISSDKGIKKKKHVSTLEQKLDIIERHEHGHSHPKIAKSLGMPQSTVRNIVNRADKIKEKANIAPGSICNRSATMIEMEDLLTAWIENCHQKGISLNRTTIQARALNLFKRVKEKNKVEETFTAANSISWFDRFKNRVNLDFTKLTSDGGNIEENAASKYLDGLKKIIKDYGFSDQQIFNVGETFLYWKRIPSTTHNSEEKKSLSKYYESRDRLKVLLSGNVRGDCKLKPMLMYGLTIPRALQDCYLDSLPVIFRLREKGWITEAVFNDWFTTYFCPSVEQYCKESNIPFKILMILDNAPSHLNTFRSTCENVKIVSLLPSTSLMHLIDQGTIAAFNTQYVKVLSDLLIAKTTGDGAMSLTDFMRNYNIRHAIENIHNVWQEINANDMRGMWRRILPHYGNSDFERKEITNRGRELGFDKLQNEDAQESLNSHSEELTEDDQLLQQKAFKEADDDADRRDSMRSKDFTLEEFEDMFRTVEFLKQNIKDVDPILDRNMKIRRDIDNVFCTYQRMYEDEFKKHDNQELEDILMFHDTSNFTNSSSTPMSSRNNPAASTSSSRKRKTSADSDDGSTNSFAIKTEEIDIDHDSNDPDLEQDDMDDDNPGGGCSDSTRDLADTKNNFQSDENNDSLDRFGKYISSLLRDLPELVSYNLQQDITGQIFDALIANQNSPSDNHLDASKESIGEQPNNAFSIPHNFP